MKLQSIQVLRGLAAFAVAMTHLVSFEREGILENGYSERALTGGLWHNGFAGVDLFFVISGFIMVYVTAGRERSARSVGDFLLARSIRIYPLWWFFLSAMAIVFLNVHGTPFHPEEYGKTDAGVAAYITKSFFLIPQEGLPILGVGWTLIHEMYFYVVFSLFLFFPERRLKYFLVGWASIIVFGYLTGGSSTKSDTFLYVALHPMTVEFIMGGFAGLLYLRKEIYSPAPIAVLGAGTFIFAMVLFQNTEVAEGGFWATLRWGRVICFGVPAALLVYGLATLEQTHKAKFPAWAVRLGDISYAFYLCHIIVFMGVMRVFHEISKSSQGLEETHFLTQAFALGVPGYIDNGIFIAVCLSSAVVVAAVSHKIFERPCMKLLNEIRRKHFLSGTQRES